MIRACFLLLATAAIALRETVDDSAATVTSETNANTEALGPSLGESLQPYFDSGPQIETENTKKGIFGDSKAFTVLQTMKVPIASLTEFQELNGKFFQTWLDTESGLYFCRAHKSNKNEEGEFVHIVKVFKDADALSRHIQSASYQAWTEASGKLHVAQLNHDVLGAVGNDVETINALQNPPKVWPHIDGFARDPIDPKKPDGHSFMVTYKAKIPATNFTFMKIADSLQTSSEFEANQDCVFARTHSHPDNKPGDDQIVKFVNMWKNPKGFFHGKNSATSIFLDEVLVGMGLQLLELNVYGNLTEDIKTAAAAPWDNVTTFWEPTAGFDRY